MRVLPLRAQPHGNGGGDVSLLLEITEEDERLAAMPPSWPWGPLREARDRLLPHGGQTIAEATIGLTLCLVTALLAIGVLAWVAWVAAEGTR